MSVRPAISVNERAAVLVEHLLADAAVLKIGVARGEPSKRVCASPPFAWAASATSTSFRRR
jgi:hypothetical protein